MGVKMEQIQESRLLGELMGEENKSTGLRCEVLSEMIQKNINKMNKRQEDNLKYMKEIKARADLNRVEMKEPLKENQIIMDLK